MRGREIFRNGGEPEMGGWKIFGKGVLSPYFMKTPQDCLPTPFSNFFQTLPHFPVTSNPHPHCTFCCPVSLAEWVIMPHLVCYIYIERERGRERDLLLLLLLLLLLFYLSLVTIYYSHRLKHPGLYTVSRI